MRLDAPLPDLGRVGVWTWGFVTEPAEKVRAAVAAYEEMGYRAAWYPESRGREAIAAAALILSAGSRIAAVSGIASIWARDPDAAAGAAAALGEAWPGRFVLGLGVSHAPSVARRGGEYVSPLARMGEYLDGLEHATFVGPDPDPAVPVVLAALGPKMVGLGAARTSGVHPYFTPVAHTELVRTQSPGTWLAPEVTVVLEEEATAARAVARNFATRYLSLDNYRRNLLRLGYDDESLSGGGTDAVIDDVIGWGDVDAVARRIGEHLDAGADHVGIHILSEHDPFALDGYGALAGKLL